MNEEQQAIQELQKMTVEELAKVPADLMKWTCCIEGCERFTRVKDFGTFPMVYWRKRWIDLARLFFYCGKHWKIYKKRVGFKCRK